MDILVTIHLILAIAVTLTLVASLALVARGTWDDRSGRLLGILAMLATGQWVLGFFVWFSAISDDFNAFTGIIHPLAMTGVVAVAHMTNARAKAVADPAARARGVRTSLLIAAVLLVVAVPWAQVFG